MPSDSAPLWKLGANDLADAIRAKRVSSEEVVRAHLDRISAVNGDLNAVTVVLEEEALAAAREADRRLDAGDAVGPLHGVPMTVKENIDLAGSATTHGLRNLEEARPALDAPFVGQVACPTPSPDHWSGDDALVSDTPPGCGRGWPGRPPPARP